MSIQDKTYLLYEKTFQQHENHSLNYYEKYGNMQIISGQYFLAHERNLEFTHWIFE